MTTLVIVLGIAAVLAVGATAVIVGVCLLVARISDYGSGRTRRQPRATGRASGGAGGRGAGGHAAGGHAAPNRRRQAPGRSRPPAASRRGNW